MSVKTVLVVFGTRPEAIKMAPLVRVLANRPQEFACKVCVTSQHGEMLTQVLDAFGIEPDYDLHVMRPDQTLFDITCDVLRGMQDVIAEVRPDLMLVHGDTTTSFAAGLAAFYAQVAVGHVEAGLRTYNTHAPWPEEFNRQAVDSLCDYFFAPTTCARDNLLREGKDPARVFVTGNTGIDALQTTVRDGFTDEPLAWARDSRLVLMTAHRRESLGEPMRGMFRAIRRVVDERPDIKVIYPVHLNPRVREVALAELGNSDRIRIIEPLDVLRFHNYLAACHLVLTDSGGIQEEAPSLGKPVLVMRDVTERPEGVEAGTSRVVGTSEQGVYTAFLELLDDKTAYEAMAVAVNPYGDGHASERIANIIAGADVKVG